MVVKLKVTESVQDDVHKGVVKLDSSYMREIGVNVGDIITITGERTTASVCDRAYPGDIGLNIIRMDGNTRRNARAGVGDIVTVEKASVAPAKRVKLAPTSKNMIIKMSADLFKMALMGRAVMKGDMVSFGARGRKQAYGFNVIGLSDIKFMVVSIDSNTPVSVVGKDTIVEYSERWVKIDEEPIDVNYDNVGGLSDEIRKVREMIELPLRHPQLFDRLGVEAPKGVLLYGPPGTGKTLLAKAVAAESGVNFMELRASEIISGVPGATEKMMGNIFDEAKDRAPSILFIDELDSIAFKRQDRGTNEFLNTPVSELLKNLDGLSSRGKVVVIAATNRPNSLDPALRRPGRFDREIEIGVPDRQGRKEILQIHTRSMPLDNVNIDQLAKITHGFVGADLESLAKEAAMIVLRRIVPEIADEVSEESLSKLVITQKDFLDALNFVRPSAMREVMVETPTVSWSDVAGAETVKQRLREAVEWPLKDSEKFARMGIRSSRGILLYGPPGTGKTMLARAVAKESEANFILVNASTLLEEGIVGKETQRLRKVFTRARQTSPSIIFIDEIDSFGKRRGTSSSAGGDANESLLNQLLVEMDGMQSLTDVVVMAATNRPEILDQALLRPGRFDNVLLVGIPDYNAREKLFEIHSKSMPCELNTTELAGMTEGYVGADIEAVCREAGMIAMRRDATSILHNDFVDALKTVKPSVSDNIVEHYRLIEKEFQTLKQDVRSYFG